MIKAQSVELYGQTYRIQLFAAIEGFERFDQHSPLVLLQKTSVVVEDQLKILDSAETIDAYVLDPTHVVAPVAVVKALMNVVHRFNFGFLDTWQPMEKPHVVENTKGVARQSKNLNPMISALLQNHYATLHELETLYSVKDVFVLYDALLEEQINKALAYHVQSKQRKRH
ncbi:hypothetical protein COMNV_01245 [Commensalibacter sp. Nvir]|uniref:hypothetical protein n=1 Tax=Commensalibacter sp. Nvir TaxID=3069817 RepID=UPI002D2C676D|nr:hypothetical protein COMNV_01245 [Commensalibacter sp. Nvir]